MQHKKDTTKEGKQARQPQGAQADYSTLAAHLAACAGIKWLIQPLDCADTCPRSSHAARLAPRRFTRLQVVRTPAHAQATPHVNEYQGGESPPWCGHLSPPKPRRMIQKSTRVDFSRKC